MWEWMPILLTALLSLLAITLMITSLLTLSAVWQDCRLRSVPSVILTANLAVVDFGMAFSVAADSVFIWIVEYSDRAGYYYCFMDCPLIQMVCMGSLLFTFLHSLDRYLYLKVAMKYRVIVSIPRLKKILVAAWVFMILFGVVPLAVSAKHFTIETCKEMYRSPVMKYGCIPFLLFAFFTSAFITGAMYISLFRVVKKNRRLRKRMYLRYSMNTTNYLTNSGFYARETSLFRYAHQSSVSVNSDGDGSDVLPSPVESNLINISIIKGRKDSTAIQGDGSLSQVIDDNWHTNVSDTILTSNVKVTKGQNDIEKDAFTCSNNSHEVQINIEQMTNSPKKIRSKDKVPENYKKSGEKTNKSESSCYDPFDKSCVKGCVNDADEKRFFEENTVTSPFPSLSSSKYSLDKDKYSESSHSHQGTRSDSLNISYSHDSGDSTGTKMCHRINLGQICDGTMRDSMELKINSQNTPNSSYKETLMKNYGITPKSLEYCHFEQNRCVIYSQSRKFRNTISNKSSFAESSSDEVEQNIKTNHSKIDSAEHGNRDYRQGRDIRTAKLLFVILCIYTTMWLPNYVVSVVDLFVEYELFYIGLVAHSLTIINSLMNFYVYSRRIPVLRQAMSNFKKRCLKVIPTNLKNLFRNITDHLRLRHLQSRK